MAAHIVADTYTFVAGSPASVIAFTPNIPAGASIGQVFAWAMDDGATSLAAGNLGVASVGFTNLVDGNQQTTTEWDLTGQLSTTAVIAVSDYAWANATAPDGVATITLTLASNVTNTHIGVIHYIVSYN